MSLMFLLAENTRVEESYCSQLWVEAERDGDHQAHSKRNADVTEWSNQQRAFLEKSSSVGETTSSQITAAKPAHTDGGVPRVKTQLGRAYASIKTADNVTK